jgi:hypothetical protein
MHHLEISTSRRQAQRKKAKTVTPSPAAAAASSSSFTFETTPQRLSTRRTVSNRFTRKKQPTSTKLLPPGVVDLYPNHHKSITLVASSMRISDHGMQTQPQQQPLYFCNQCNGEAENCSLNSLTIEYIRVYGQEYWKRLHATESVVFKDCHFLRHSSQESPSSSFTNEEDATDHEVGHHEQVELPIEADHVIEEKGGGEEEENSETSSTVSIIRTPMTPTKRHNYVKQKFWDQWKHEPQDAVTRLFSHHEPKESGAFLTQLHQPELTPKMRAILVDWMIELSEHFPLGPATLHLAITLADRVLASGPLSEEGALAADEELYLLGRDFPEAEAHEDADDFDEQISLGTKCYRIRRSRYQLLGGTCTWMACKLLETSPPKARDVAFVSDGFYTVSQVKSMERRVCNALQFSFFQEPTPYQFLLEFLRASHEGDLFLQQHRQVDVDANDATTRCCHSYCGFIPVTESVFSNMANYLLELGRLPVAPTTYKPSLLAAAAVYLARVTLNLRCDHPNPSCDPNGFWTPSLEYYSGYTKDDLKETVLEIHTYHLTAESTTNLKSTFTKYRSRKYQRVALQTVIPKNNLGFVE